MACSVTVLVLVVSLHIIAFVLAIGAESRRSSAKVVPDKYDERTYCVYTTDASAIYGASAFLLLLVSQLVLNGVTKCLFFGKGLIEGTSTCCAKFFFFLSWVSFLGAEACLFAGSVRNAYHTKYKGYFGAAKLSCATLRKGVFAAAAALIILSMLSSLLYYWLHSKADTGGWKKHQNEGIDMGSSDYPMPHH